MQISPQPCQYLLAGLVHSTSWLTEEEELLGKKENYLVINILFLPKRPFPSNGLTVYKHLSSLSAKCPFFCRCPQFGSW
jgi:hypothetical protein